jgi:hypothetical protein
MAVVAWWLTRERMAWRDKPTNKRWGTLTRSQPWLATNLILTKHLSPVSRDDICLAIPFAPGRFALGQSPKGEVKDMLKASAHTLATEQQTKKASCKPYISTFKRDPHISLM